MFKNVKGLVSNLVIGSLLSAYFVLPSKIDAQYVSNEEELKIEEKLNSKNLTDKVIENSITEGVLNSVNKTAKELVIEDIIKLAESKIGCRYSQKPNERNGENSFDCSGFVRYLYLQTTGIDVGTWTGNQEQVLKGVKVPMNELQLGDLVFGKAHVAIYVGNGEIIHASNSKPYPQGGVKRSKLYSGLNRAYRPLNLKNYSELKK